MVLPIQEVQKFKKQFNLLKKIAFDIRTDTLFKEIDQSIKLAVINNDSSVIISSEQLQTANDSKVATADIHEVISFESDPDPLFDVLRDFEQEMTKPVSIQVFIESVKVAYLNAGYDITENDDTPVPSLIIDLDL